jgi:hypothetical protein
LGRFIFVVITDKSYGAGKLPPAAVHPKPLFGILADPVFNNIGDKFGGAPDIYIAILVPG